MGLLERLEAVYGHPDFVGIMRSERNQLRNGPIVLRNDKSLSGFYPLEQLGQMRFRFKCTNFRHLVNLVDIDWL